MYSRHTFAQIVAAQSIAHVYLSNTLAHALFLLKIGITALQVMCAVKTIVAIRIYWTFGFLQHALIHRHGFLPRLQIRTRSASTGEVTVVYRCLSVHTRRSLLFLLTTGKPRARA